MADPAAKARRGPVVFNIPPHRAFADALVTGVIAHYGAAPLDLARGLILLPNNRAVLAVRDAFVRKSEGGLLLPRLVPIGDDDLEAQLGSALDPIDDSPPPTAIAPLQRQLILARMIQTERALARLPIDAAEAMRLAADLARTLDQLIIEDVQPQALHALDVAELSKHWQVSLDLMAVVLTQWPEALAKLGKIDLTDRRNRLLARLATRWEAHPRPGFTLAAGVSTVAPAIAILLRVVARMEGGAVVLAGLDSHLAEADWDTIGGRDDLPPVETHPQFHLRLLLDRMKVARGEVRAWRWGSDHDAAAQRSLALSHAMALPEATKAWHTLPARALRMSGVAAVTCDAPAQEAQVIALALRAALDVPNQTAALVTPDRALASRVVALLARWGIAADDSAGQPLSATLAGGLVLAIMETLVHQFAPVPLLSLLKHPLVQGGDARLRWLDQVRALDIALRGPRPAAGIDGITRFLAVGDPRRAETFSQAREAWAEISALFVPIATMLASGPQTLPALVAVVRDASERLGGDAVWAGGAGSALADLLMQLEEWGDCGPLDLTLTSFAKLLRQLMENVAVRRSGAIHPRISIWGQIEARLQTADVMILGGLNEGVWPALPSPDPWLAPRIRRQLNLPTLERRIGIAAHDLVSAMGAHHVLLTRAKRDARSATVASRFWLRLDALLAGLAKPTIDYPALAHALDQPPAGPRLSKRPAPTVPLHYRPRVIRVTDVDRLNADPYSFYARAILKLSPLDTVDADPSGAWRGTLIHSALEAWAKDGGYHPDTITGHFDSAFARANLHPLLGALWLPRFQQAAKSIAARVADDAQAGRRPLLAEIRGKIEIAGVILSGQLDRIDRAADGSLAIVDYKTGAPPTPAQVASGYALQLGLIGIMAQRGGFAGVSGTASQFEYWSLARQQKAAGYGYVRSALAKDQTAAAFLGIVEAHFSRAVETWLTGDAPFTAKLQPDYAYTEYDHLMRYDEWAGRDGGL